MPKVSFSKWWVWQGLGPGASGHSAGLHLPLPSRRQHSEDLGRCKKGRPRFLDGLSIVLFNTCLVNRSERSSLLKICRVVIFQSKLQRAMETSVRLDKEILLRNELLEKIERETLQVGEVGEGKMCCFWCLSFSVYKGLSRCTPQSFSRKA